MLTLTNITGKIMFVNKYCNDKFKRKVTVSVLKKNNKCNRIKSTNAFFTSKQTDKIILKE